MNKWSMTRLALILGAVAILFIDSLGIPSIVGVLALLSSIAIGWAQAGYSSRSTSSDRTTARVMFWLAAACVGIYLVRLFVAG